MSSPKVSLMQQYTRLKEKHKSSFLFFRLGDFYELFYEDAEIAAPILEVTLTQRQNVPMCGVPVHVLDRYLTKLVRKGHCVAIAEQCESSDKDVKKSIVERKVVRVVSPGTIIEDNILYPKNNNFILAISHPEKSTKMQYNHRIGLAFLDISTGEFKLIEIEYTSEIYKLYDEIVRIQPTEIILPKDHSYKNVLMKDWVIYDIEDCVDHKYEYNLSNLNKIQSKVLLEASKYALNYVRSRYEKFIPNIQEPTYVYQSDYMNLDADTVCNLEILCNQYDHSTADSVLCFLDKTLTSMGGRLLKQWLIRPLLKQEDIEQRLNVVELFLKNPISREICRNILRCISDLERILIRIHLYSDSVKPRDLIAIRDSLIQVNLLRKELDMMDTSDLYFKSLIQGCIGNKTIIHTLQNALIKNCHSSSFIGIIQDGYHAELDEKRKLTKDVYKTLSDFENQEKKDICISNFKIAYNSIFGYFFEINKEHLSKVPKHWYRKQTLTHVERFVSQELKELEFKITHAQEESKEIERSIFYDLVDMIKNQASKIRSISHIIAILDCLLSFSFVSDLRCLVRPIISQFTQICDGFHPVIQNVLSDASFIKNDCSFKDMDIMILTGPNMSGKSTYLRQNALIFYMMHIGCFVSAKTAHLELVDKIFTRIGSSDRLAQGKSTFMLEMTQTAEILKNSTKNSFIILDEVGRGTSTYDGISIAWAIVEYFAHRVKSKVLFATHYFELTQLTNFFPNIKNYCINILEKDDKIFFLHRIIPGSINSSYGVHVAQISGIPDEIICRSKQILIELSSDSKRIKLSGKEYEK